MLLENRVVLVTGASRGIGAATAKLLAANGAAVGVNYFRSEAPARALVAEIEAVGGRGVALAADVRDRMQVEAMVATLATTFGPVDTLVVNASIGFPVKPFTDFEWADFEAKLIGEMKAAFNCCQAVTPSMIARRQGCIIAISSGLSRHAGPGFVAHSTAKSGLDAFVRALALELGPHGIRVNTVAPGLTLTDATAWIPEEHKEASAMATPMGRNGLPEDIAGAVLMMASDYSGFVTGSYLPVSGGVLML